MAVDKEAISVSRVYSYGTILSVTCPYTKCNPPYLLVYFVLERCSNVDEARGMCDLEKAC